MKFSLFLGLSLPGLLAQQCLNTQGTSSLPLCNKANVIVRHDLFKDTSMRDAFFQGFQAVTNRPEFKQIIDLVEAKFKYPETTDMFWLRVLLYLFEKEMQKNVPNAKLLYWDSAKDYPFSESSAVASYEYLGWASGNGCLRLKQFPYYYAVSIPHWDHTCISRNSENINDFLVDQKNPRFIYGISFIQRHPS
ncbi:hypothetical protein DSO57_1001268 [Entomophthora muscae]|uniref:Uncharacterized protein n=1 Tax=Entomophthora muscae TaxID=34485 RepID=A0ACC2T8R9_9FUNG|nr:hypothetical protein DSO57_1001268 [Entomophthora muscae]